MLCQCTLAEKSLAVPQGSNAWCLHARYTEASSMDRFDCDTYPVCSRSHGSPRETFRFLLGQKYIYISLSKL